jgi:hypothetical protein
MNLPLFIIPIALMSALIGYLGRQHKFGFWGNFAISLVLTPLVGLLVYIAQTPKQETQKD